MTEITLRTVPLPAARCRPRCSCRFAKLVRRGRNGCRLPRCLARGVRPVRLEVDPPGPRGPVRSIGNGIHDAAESVLVLPFEGDDPDEALGRARLLAERVRRGGAARGRSCGDGEAIGSASGCSASASAWSSRS